MATCFHCREPLDQRRRPLLQDVTTTRAVNEIVATDGPGCGLHRLVPPASCG